VSYQIPDIHGKMIGSQDWVVPVGFEVLTVVVMESSLFWGVTPCGLEEDMASIFKQVASSEDGGSLFLQNMVDCQWTTEYYVPEHETLELYVITWQETL
jgi:hypothetical protein